MRAASRRFMPRIPSLPHPEDVIPRHKPRVPSAQHPDDLAAELEAERRRKEGIVKRLGKRVGKQIQKKHACERACMCALAVSLLWLTSLVVAKEVVQFFVPTPTIESVIDGGERLFSTSVDQRGFYRSCAESAARTCRLEFDRESEAELERLALIQGSVESRLEAIKSELLLCSGAFENASNIFEEVTAINLLNPTYVDSTTPGICADTDLVLLLSQQAAAADSLAEIEAYKGIADDNVNTLNNQLAARAAYDIEYLDNKTGGAFSEIANNLLANMTSPEEFVNRVDQQYAEMMACMDESGTFQTLNGTTVVCPEGSVFAKARAEFIEMRDQYNSLRSSAESYRNSIEQKLSNFRVLLEVLQDANDLLNTAGLGSILALIAGMSGEIVPDLLSPLLAQLLEGLVASPAEIYEDALLAAQAVRDAAAEGAALLNETNAAFLADSNRLFGSIFDDYNPPPVDRNASNADYNAASQAILGETAAELNAAVTDEDGNVNVNEFVESVNEFNASEAGSQLLEKADPREWAEAYLYEDEIFNRLQEGLLRVNDWALFLDYAYRIVRSLMLIRKYWNISAINTPPADVRTKVGISEGTFKQKDNIIQRLGKLAANPYMNLIFLFLFIGLFSWAFYTAYSPLYDQYTQNCVGRCYQEITNTLKDGNGNLAFPNPAGEGTMLYRNSYAVAEQYAFADGDYVANTEVDAIGVEREVACTENTVDSVKLELNQDDRLNFYNERQADVNEKIEYFRQCVDVDQFVTDNPVYDLSPLLDGTITQTQCINLFAAHEVWLLEAGNVVPPPDNGDYGRIYNCDSVSPCEFTCDGPNESLLRGAAFEAACTGEWYVHASVLGVLMTFIVFVITNISRLVFMNGVVKVYWRHLSSHKFSFLASCTEDGTVIYPEAVTKDGLTFRKVIIKQLRIALRRFEAVGWALVIFGGVVMNAPWITVLAVLRENLQFDSNKVCNV